MSEDTPVPTVYDDLLAGLAEADARIGLVNPNSNEFGALASVQKVPLPASVERNYHESKGLSVERCSVIGFFALVKREVVQKIGGFDPAYSPGYSEDDDYSERARVEGYLCARALGAYVHHFGSKSFQTDQKKALKQRHETILRKRWGALRREAVLVRGNDLRDREQAESFCEKLKERLRKRTGYIYVFVPKSKRSLFALNHDYLRIKTYPSRGMGTLFFFLWRIFRKKSKPVVVISPDMLQDE